MNNAKAALRRILTFSVPAPKLIDEAKEFHFYSAVRSDGKVIVGIQHCAITLNNGYTVVGTAHAPPGGDTPITTLRDQALHDASLQLGRYLNYLHYQDIEDAVSISQATHAIKKDVATT